MRILVLAMAVFLVTSCGKSKKNRGSAEIYDDFVHTSADYFFHCRVNWSDLEGKLYLIGTDNEQNVKSVELNSIVVNERSVAKVSHFGKLPAQWVITDNEFILKSASDSVTEFYKNNEKGVQTFNEKVSFAKDSTILEFNRAKQQGVLFLNTRELPVEVCEFK